MTLNLPCKGSAGCGEKATKYLTTKRYGVIGYCNPCATDFDKAQATLPKTLRRELQVIR